MADTGKTIAIWMCPNCHLGTRVTFDNEGQRTYEHISFEWKDGIEYARLACDPSNLKVVSRME